MRTFAPIVTTLSVAALLTPSAHAIDEAHTEKAQQLIDKATQYLVSQQDEATGGWSIPPADAQSPQLPAISALVLNGLLLDHNKDEHAEAIDAGIEYILSMQQEDGGIYDAILPNYNTSLAVSALTRADTPEADAAVDKAVRFLKKLQWSQVADPNAGGDEAPHTVSPEHPYYGGVGYGKHGRPDNSNLNIMLQALHDAGVSPDDDAFERAVTFLERTQMHKQVNDMPYAQGSTQGGFIYATVPNAATLSAQGGVGQSQAGMIEETLDDGTTVSRLRAYGSMTYAGFKSYIYADLDRNDPRVQLAYWWLRSNYTLEENPGMGQQGYYYYLITMSRALDAWGEETISARNTAKLFDSRLFINRDWGNDLVDALADLQQPDGSFRSVHDRWMENNPVLITAYSVLALEHAIGVERQAKGDAADSKDAD